MNITDCLNETDSTSNSTQLQGKQQPRPHQTVQKNIKHKRFDKQQSNKDSFSKSPTQDSNKTHTKKCEEHTIGLDTNSKKRKLNQKLAPILPSTQNKQKISKIESSLVSPEKISQIDPNDESVLQIPRKRSWATSQKFLCAPTSDNKKLSIKFDISEMHQTGIKSVGKFIQYKMNELNKEKEHSLGSQTFDNSNNNNQTSLIGKSSYINVEPQLIPPPTLHGGIAPTLSKESSKRKFNIVLDLDGVILVDAVYWYNGNLVFPTCTENDGVDNAQLFVEQQKNHKYFVKCHPQRLVKFDFTENMSLYMILTHGILELLYYLWTHENVETISFFSAGDRGRNIAVVDYLFKQMPDVRKREDIIVKSREDRKPFSDRFLRQFLDPGFEDCKDLKQNFPDFDINNTLLIDDCPQASQFDEQYNLVQSPANKFECYEDGDWCSKSVNSSFYLCGLIDRIFKTCIENKKNLVDHGVIDVQSKYNTQFYKDGLEILGRYSLDIDFLSLENIDKQANLGFVFKK